MPTTETDHTLKNQGACWTLSLGWLAPDWTCHDGDDGKAQEQITPARRVEAVQHLAQLLGAAQRLMVEDGKTTLDKIHTFLAVHQPEFRNPAVYPRGAPADPLLETFVRLDHSLGLLAVFRPHPGGDAFLTYEARDAVRDMADRLGENDPFVASAWRQPYRAHLRAL